MTKSLNESSIAENIEENAETLAEAVQNLRALVRKEKYLKVRDDDNFMLRYLRCSNYDPEMALRKMQAYYKHKHQHSDWYATDESMLSFKEDFNNKLYYALEGSDRFGKKIYVNRIGMIDPSKTTMSVQSRIHDFFLESMLDEEETQKNGISVIVDLKNFSWTLLKWLTPTNVCIAVKKVETLPFKKIEFHVVNTSIVLNAAIKLIWPFLSYNTKQNIFFHYENWASLHKTIPPECLPTQYGGTKLIGNIEKLMEIIPGGNERLKENLLLGYTQI